MNRRSFIGGVLASMAAPFILVPRFKDHTPWKVIKEESGLYTAKVNYAVYERGIIEVGEGCTFDPLATIGLGRFLSGRESLTSPVGSNPTEQALAREQSPSAEWQPARHLKSEPKPPASSHTQHWFV